MDFDFRAGGDGGRGAGAPDSVLLKRRLRPQLRAPKREGLVIPGLLASLASLASLAGWRADVLEGLAGFWLVWPMSHTLDAWRGRRIWGSVLGLTELSGTAMATISARPQTLAEKKIEGESTVVRKF